MNTTPIDQAVEFSDEITLHVQRYNPQLLSARQRATMLEDIRVLVLKAEPRSKVLAGHYLSTLSRFVSQSTPASGGLFSDYFTDARIDAWVNASLTRNASPHTLRSAKGHLQVLLRAHQGLPIKVAHNLPAAVGVAPLKSADLELIRKRCVSTGTAALRGFVSGFCAGVVDDSGDGARFVRTALGPSLRMPDGSMLPVLRDPADLRVMESTFVRDGDWREVRAIANELGIRLDRNIARQTFRSLIVIEEESLASLVARFRLNEESLASLIPFLAPVDLDKDAVAVAALRGPELNGTNQTSSSPTGPLKRRVHESTHLNTVSPVHPLSIVDKEVSR